MIFMKSSIIKDECHYYSCSVWIKILTLLTTSLNVHQRLYTKVLQLLYMLNIEDNLWDLLKKTID